MSPDRHLSSLFTPVESGYKYPMVRFHLSAPGINNDPSCRVVRVFKSGSGNTSQSYTAAYVHVVVKKMSVERNILRTDLYFYSVYTEVVKTHYI